MRQACDCAYVQVSKLFHAGEFLRRPIPNDRLTGVTGKPRLPGVGQLDSGEIGLASGDALGGGVQQFKLDCAQAGATRAK
jgi:hypothetical protein